MRGHQYLPSQGGQEGVTLHIVISHQVPLPHQEWIDLDNLHVPGFCHTAWFTLAESLKSKNERNEDKVAKFDFHAKYFWNTIKTYCKHIFRYDWTGMFYRPKSSYYFLKFLISGFVFEIWVKMSQNCDFLTISGHFKL